MATKKQAGAGRGFVNPQRTDETDAEYVTPKQRYDMEKQMEEEKTAAKTEKAYNAATGYKRGGMTASKRADGCAERGKTKGTMVMCGGGYAKGMK
jgi:hypothetical protein